MTNKEIREMRLRIIADHDQDLAECDVWWRDTPPKFRKLVWERIQREHTDPIDEIVSRFAQLGFTGAFLRNAVRRSEGGGVE